MAQYYGYETIPRDGLVAEYLLDGNANDTAGSNNGTATNVTWVNADRGYVKKCGSFNGGNSGVNISNSTTTNNLGVFSVGAFIKINSFNTNQMPFSKNWKWFNIKSDGAIEGDCHFSTTASRSTSHSGIIKLNTWTYVQYTIGADKIIHIYVNGIEVTYSVQRAGVGIEANDSSKNWLIGRYNGDGFYFNGNIGLVRIYNRVLSQKEINNLYLEGLRKFGPSIIQQNNGAFSKYTPLSLPKPVLHIDGTHNLNTYYDQSGNGNHGTQSGGVIVSNLGLNKVMRTTSNTSSINLGTNSIIGAGDKTISGLVYQVNGQWSVFCYDWDPNYKNIIFGLSNNWDNIINVGIGNGGTTQHLNIVRAKKTYLNQWTHIAFTLQGNNTKLYINGRLEDSGTSNYIGGVTPLNTRMFNSSNTPMSATIGQKISDIKIYNQALTPQQIQALYYSNKII